MHRKKFPLNVMTYLKTISLYRLLTATYFDGEQSAEYHSLNETYSLTPCEEAICRTVPPIISVTSVTPATSVMSVTSVTSVTPVSAHSV